MLPSKIALSELVRGSVAVDGRGWLLWELNVQIEAQLQALVSFCPSEARMQFSSIKNLQSKRAKLPHLSGKCICGLHLCKT